MPPQASSSACLQNGNALGAADALRMVSGAQRAASTDPRVDPVGESEFAELMAYRCPVPEGAPVAVAVSGGGDSMALALLAGRWAEAAGRKVTGLTIDHGLRPGSRAEAERVGGWLAERGARHVILSWDGLKPTTGVQEAARAARYRLIGAWAREQGVRHVLLAHQIEDQAETILMRIARGSGITGLGVMRDVTERDGVRYLRPLLGISRVRLRATLACAGQEWLEDPSNDSPLFARTSFRRLVAALEPRGLGAARIAGLAQAFARLDAIMDAAVRSSIGAGVAFDARGHAVIDAKLLRAMPDWLALLVVRRLLVEVGGRSQPPRGDRLARARDRLRRHGTKPFTLAGCRVAPGSDTIQVAPEARPRSNEGFRSPAFEL